MRKGRGWLTPRRVQKQGRPACAKPKRPREERPSSLIATARHLSVLSKRWARRPRRMSPHGHRGRTEARPRHRRVADCALRAEPRASGALQHDVRARERAALHACERRDRLRPRPRLSGRLPVHARRLSLDVPREALDDAPVRGLRHGRGDERALPLPARPRPDGPLDGLRHADPHGLRLRPPEVSRRGRPRGRRHRLARGHGAALRRGSPSARSRPR